MATRPRRLVVAVIGCGQWGPNQIRNFMSLPAVDVRYAVDSDAGRLVRVKQMFPRARTTQEVSQVLTDASVDAVVVTTPTSTHYDIVRMSLLAGKHVLCEKPLCEREHEAREVSALAQERGLVLMTGHVFLFNAGILTVKRILSSGEFGELRYLSSTRTNLGPIRTDVNVAYDLASHDVAVFNFLIGSEPRSVSATGAAFLQDRIEDVVMIALRYAGGITGFIEVSWINPKKVRQMTVVGSRRMLTWDDLSISTPVAIYDSGAEVLRERRDPSDYAEFLRVSMWDGDVRIPKVQTEEPLRVQARHFVDCVRDNTIKVQSDGRFSAGIVRVLEGVNESIRRNGAAVDLRSDQIEEDNRH